jgi:hypothetical protein
VALNLWGMTISDSNSVMVPARQSARCTNARRHRPKWSVSARDQSG